jgi:long-chain acyl-CoA synthetase
MEKIWFESYPHGVPGDINPDEYRSVVEMFERFCEKFSTHVAFSNFGTDLSFRELEEKTRSLAAYFQHELKLEKGDRLAIMMPNLLQYPVVIFAALRVGLVVVNINPLYTGRELKFNLCDSQAKAIVIAENFAHTLAEVYKEAPFLKHILVTQLGDFLGVFKKPIFNFVIKYVKKMVPNWDIPGTISLPQAMSKGSKHKFKPVRMSGEDTAFLQYTGGTTGVPKGAELTHRNIVANVLQALSWFRSHPDLELGREVALGALPMYHIFALTVCSFVFLSIGAKCLLITNPRDIPGLIKTLSKNPVSVFIGLNTLFIALMHNLDIGKANLDKVKVTVAGGTATFHDISDQWEKLTGKPIIQGYGLTEASPIVLINPLLMKTFNGSAGLPVPSTDIEIRDDSGKALPQGHEGELFVKGPQVMKGYWQAPEETKKTIDANGWLATGDIARVDEHGFVYIVDRKKDLIIVSGFNVYPNEIEDVIASNPGVREVAVIGVPSSQTGEAIKVYIIKKDPNLTEEELIAFCRKNLTGYKIPKIIEFVDTLPKTPVGKVLKRVLRENNVSHE